jgi:hypothetical protein
MDFLHRKTWKKLSLVRCLAWVLKGIYPFRLNPLEFGTTPLFRAVPAFHPQWHRQVALKRL